MLHAAAETHRTPLLTAFGTWSLALHLLLPICCMQELWSLALPLLLLFCFGSLLEPLSQVPEPESISIRSPGCDATKAPKQAIGPKALIWVNTFTNVPRSGSDDEEPSRRLLSGAGRQCNRQAESANRSRPECGFSLQLRLALLLHQAGLHSHLGFLSAQTAVSQQGQGRAWGQCQLVQGLHSCIRTVRNVKFAGPQMHFALWNCIRSGDMCQGSLSWLLQSLIIVEQVML